MKQIETRPRPRIPAISYGGGVSGARLDRHLAVLGGPALPQRETEDATLLMREMTARTPERTTARKRTAGVSLLAPLRRLHRTLFGGRR